MGFAPFCIYLGFFLKNSIFQCLCFRLLHPTLRNEVDLLNEVCRNKWWEKKKSWVVIFYCCMVLVRCGYGGVVMSSSTSAWISAPLLSSTHCFSHTNSKFNTTPLLKAAPSPDLGSNSNILSREQIGEQTQPKGSEDLVDSVVIYGCPRKEWHCRILVR